VLSQLAKVRFLSVKTIILYTSTIGDVITLVTYLRYGELG